MKTGANWTDAELICRCLGYDEKAFEVLYNQYKVPLFSFSLKYIDNPLDVEEIVQDTLLKAYQHLETLRDTEQFSSWLFSIAAQRIVAWYRKNRQRIDRELLSCVSEQILQAASVTAYRVAQQDVADRARLKSLLSLIDTLSDSEKTVLRLRLDGLSYEEMANKLGISVAAVKHRLYRAKKKLKELTAKDAELQ